MTPKGTVRLSSDSDGFSGFLEMWLDGSWRSFCGEIWDEKNDEVVCRQLGLGPPLAEKMPELVSSGAVMAHHFYYNCSGNEDRLTQCVNEPITDILVGADICKEVGYASVACSGETCVHHRAMLVLDDSNTRYSLVKPKLSAV